MTFQFVISFASFGRVILNWTKSAVAFFSDLSYHLLQFLPCNSWASRLQLHLIKHPFRLLPSTRATFWLLQGQILNLNKQVLLKISQTGSFVKYSLWKASIYLFLPAAIPLQVHLHWGMVRSQHPIGFV